MHVPKQMKGNSMKEDIKNLQDAVRKLEERLFKLEQEFRSQQATREAAVVNKARESSEASIRRLEKE
jgi:protein subunit release factor B